MRRRGYGGPEEDRQDAKDASPELLTTMKVRPKSSSFVVLSPLVTEASRIPCNFSILLLVSLIPCLGGTEHDEETY